MNAEKRGRRRTPKQRRARETVEAVLDAVGRVANRWGAEGITTNDIAAAAGVSIGSLYQYFPDKRAILVAVRERHVGRMGHIVEQKVVEYAKAPLDQLVQGLVEAMVEAHACDPALYEVLLTQLPQDGDHEPEERLRNALKDALASRETELDRSFDLDRALFVVTHMLESLVHGVVLHRPPSLSLVDATQEAVRAVLGYIRAAA